MCVFRQFINFKHSKLLTYLALEWMFSELIRKTGKGACEVHDMAARIEGK